MRFISIRLWKEHVSKYFVPIYDSMMVLNGLFLFRHRARTRELPGNYPFVVQKTFIDAAIKEWRAPSLILCKTVHAALSEHVKKLVNKHFSEFGQGHLEQRIK
jgi:hypothetical protein